MKTQFDITEISNLIMKAMVRELMKEVPAESINDAVYRAWLKKQYAKTYKSMPTHIRFMCGLPEEMISFENMIRCEIAIKDFGDTKEYIKIYEKFLEEIELFKNYEKYSQFYLDLYRLILEQAAINSESSEMEERLRENLKSANIITAGQETTKQEIVLPSEYPKIWERTICEKCPWIIPFLIILQIMMIGIAVKELGAGLIEVGQEAIVRIEGKQDIFFVESDSAKVYCEPYVHADIIGEVYYSDKIKRIEGTNMWDKIIYYDTTGEIHIGWIASKEVISYKEWKFNLDK